MQVHSHLAVFNRPCRAPAGDLKVGRVFRGGGVGVALFQYGFGSDDLTGTMEVFVSLIEGQFFS